MGLGARAAGAALLLLLLLAPQVLLPGAAAGDAHGSTTNSESLHNATVSPTESVQPVTSNHTDRFNSSTEKPSTTSLSATSSNITIVTMKPGVPKTSTPWVSTNMTTTLTSTTRGTNVSSNTTQTTTAHSSRLTSLTITATIHSKESKGSKFDAGSFVGGIILTLGVLSMLYIGCKVYYSRRGIRYRSIDEHDAII